MRLGFFISKHIQGSFKQWCLSNNAHVARRNDMKEQDKKVIRQALEAMKGIRELHRGQGGLTLSEINRIHKNHHKSIDELTQLLEQPEPVQEPLVAAAEELRNELRKSRFKLDIKKDFSLLAADAALGTVLHKISVSPDGGTPGR